METSCVKKLHQTESSAVLALSSRNSQDSKLLFFLICKLNKEYQGAFK